MGGALKGFTRLHRGFCLNHNADTSSFRRAQNKQINKPVEIQIEAAKVANWRRSDLISYNFFSILQTIGMQKGVRSKTFFFLKEVLDKMTVKKMLK